MQSKSLDIDKTLGQYARGTRASNAWWESYNREESFLLWPQDNAGSSWLVTCRPCVGLRFIKVPPSDHHPRSVWRFSLYVIDNCFRTVDMVLVNNFICSCKHVLMYWPFSLPHLCCWNFSWNSGGSSLLKSGRNEQVENDNREM